MGADVLDQRRQPSLQWNRVVIQKHQEFAACRPRALIAGLGKSEVLFVADHLYVTPEHPEKILHAVRRSVIDQNHFIGHVVGDLRQRRQTLPGQGRIVPDGNNDRAGIRWLLRPALQPRQMVSLCLQHCRLRRHVRKVFSINDIGGAAEGIVIVTGHR